MLPLEHSGGPSIRYQLFSANENLLPRRGSNPGPAEPEAVTNRLVE